MVILARACYLGLSWAKADTPNGTLGYAGACGNFLFGVSVRNPFRQRNHIFRQNVAQVLRRLAFCGTFSHATTVS